MVSAGTLTAVRARSDNKSGEMCPRCGSGTGPLPSVSISALHGVPLRRCGRCGSRCTAGEVPARLLFTCESCGNAFLDARLLPHGEHRCADCGEGYLPSQLPDTGISEATEAEVAAALGQRWRIVTSPTLQAYVDRLTQSLVERVEGAPTAGRVLLVEEDAHRTLGLPSGRLLVSLGAIRFLEDEAELAFVLAHELAHAASGDAAIRLTRLGFQSTARAGRAPSQSAWADAADDLIRLGYGRRRERDADARALEALLALDYDPASAVRYLKRLEAAIERGDPRVSEVAMAHPIPADRILRLEKALYGRIGEDSVLRVNREVFRRAADPDALAAPMTRIDLTPWPSGKSDRSAKRGTRRYPRWVLALAGSAALGALLLGLLWLLSR